MHSPRALFAAAAVVTLSFAAPAASQPQPARVSVNMSNFKFDPRTVQLRAGAPVVLHLVNDSAGGHNFTAREFFAAARIAEASKPLVRGGTVEVARHSAVDVELVPAAGQYPLKCSHTLHSTFGMKGAIVAR